MARQRIPALPPLLQRKLYKTGQTRGADDDEIFQNRVSRRSTVLIPFRIWASTPAVREIEYENGFIVLIDPEEYFESQPFLEEFGLELGRNALVFYQRRADWRDYHPQRRRWRPATARTGPLGGEFVARVANTTSEEDERENHGFTTGKMKGAGIRQYEYAPSTAINECRIQLEALLWHAEDALQDIAPQHMGMHEAQTRRDHALRLADTAGLLDLDRLIAQRILSPRGELVCPLCQEKIRLEGFLTRLPQAFGREKHDLTVTGINLFHIRELSYGSLNHVPYNLGWGHHHCNVVCKDSGIVETLEWMQNILSANAPLLKRGGP